MRTMAAVMVTVLAGLVTFAALIAIAELRLDGLAAMSETALTREVAYGSLPKARRARLHAAFADSGLATGAGSSG